MVRRRSMLLAAVLVSAALAGAQVRPVVKGPAHGSLVIVGGGKVGRDILQRFFELAGGKDAPLVVIPTAGGEESYPPDWNGLKMFKAFGATHITVLHTTDQHMLTRNRQDDLEEVVAAHPDVLGIGIDESTAIVVQGQTFEVVGASKIAVHDGRSAPERNGTKYFFMGPGEKYDLTTLEPLKRVPTPER